MQTSLPGPARGLQTLTLSSLYTQMQPRIIVMLTLARCKFLFTRFLVKVRRQQQLSSRLRFGSVYEASATMRTLF